MQSALLQRFHESRLPVFVGPFVRQAAHRVIGNEVQLALVFFQQLHEVLRVLEPVVHALEQDVLVGDDPVGRPGVMAAGLHELFEGIALVERYDRGSGPVVGGVKGNGQLELYLLFGQLVDLRNQAAGGERDSAGADAEPPVGVDDPHRPQHLAVIGQRFPHAHDDDVVDRAGLTGQFPDLHDLVDDLGRRHVPNEALQPARAESAAYGASHLRGNAERVPPRSADEHGLHLLAVSEFEQVLRGGSVAGFRPMHRGQRVEARAVGQRGAERPGQIGHFVERSRGLLVYPGGDLSGPVARFVHFGDEPRNLGQRQAPQVGFAPRCRP